MLVLVAFVLVAWGATAVDVARRRDLRVRRRVVWFVLTLVMPIPVIPAYWLIRPLHPKKRAVASALSAKNARSRARALAEQTPGTPGVCEQDDVWAADALPQAEGRSAAAASSESASMATSGEQRFSASPKTRTSLRESASLR